MGPNNLHIFIKFIGKKMVQKIPLLNRNYFHEVLNSLKEYKFVIYNFFYCVGIEKNVLWENTYAEDFSFLSIMFFIAPYNL